MNFSSQNLIGEGGFGYVYMGFIDEQTLSAASPEIGMAVAVKKLSPTGTQGHEQWLVGFFILSCSLSLKNVPGSCIDCVDCRLNLVTLGDFVIGTWSSFLDIARKGRIGFWSMNIYLKAACRIFFSKVN